MFEIGDKVVCIKGLVTMYWTLTEGATYYIKDITKCSCGVLFVDVGISLGSKMEIMCIYCGNILEPNPVYNNWHHYKRFAKPVDNKEEIKKEEEVLV